MFDALVVIGSVVHIILSQVDVSIVPPPPRLPPPQPHFPNLTLILLTLSHSGLVSVGHRPCTVLYITSLYTV